MRASIVELCILAAFAGASAQRRAMPMDVSKLTVGTPAIVTELDLGTLKGELRQVGWSSDDTQFYVQTADGDPQSPKLRHKAALNEKLNVVRLKLLGETVSEFVNERPIPGLMFGWGPPGTGVIAYTTRDGQLKLLDQDGHKRTIAGVKEALLPAWSNDGARLAWAQKSGRKKYALMVAAVSKG